MNPIPRVDSYFFKIRSKIVLPCLGLLKGLFLVGLRVKSFKTILSSSVLATRPADLNLLNMTTMTILGERYYEVPHC